MTGMTLNQKHSGRLFYVVSNVVQEGDGLSLLDQAKVVRKSSVHDLGKP